MPEDRWVEHKLGVMRDIINRRNVLPTSVTCTGTIKRSGPTTQHDEILPDQDAHPCRMARFIRLECGTLALDWQSFRHLRVCPDKIPDRLTIWRFNEKPMSNGKIHFIWMTPVTTGRARVSDPTRGIIQDASIINFDPRHARSDKPRGMRQRPDEAGSDAGLREETNYNTDKSFIRFCRKPTLSEGKA